MILIEAGDRSEAGFEARLILAGQLRAQGYSAVIDEATLPPEIGRHQKYEATTLIVASGDLTPRHVLILSDGAVSDETLATLHDYRLAPEVGVALVGRFPGRQAELGARARIAYAIGREPHLVDLRDLAPAPLLPHATAPDLISEPERGQGSDERVRLSLFLSAKVATSAGAAAPLQRLFHDPKLRLRIILTDGWSEALHALQHAVGALCDLAELPPPSAIADTDIAALYLEEPVGARLGAILTACLGRGIPVIDGTAEEVLVTSGAPALRGPADLSALGAYLDGAVLPNLGRIGETLLRNPWCTARHIGRFVEAAGLPRPTPRNTAAQRPGRTLFLPTNGVGLGHAQRCTLIAGAMTTPLAFAAFPSCLPLIAARGFAATALVQRSPDHPEPFANDLLNHLRMQRLLADGDTFAFDGGFIFDSVARAIRERAIRSVWIRRGLWQPGASASRTFDRGHLFNRVIVPSEAFPELNGPSGWDGRISTVGPIVRHEAEPPDTAGIRSRLSDHFTLRCDRLVVTMLGSGAAADRLSQLQFLCSLFDRRADTLHLIVVWPGAVVPPGLYGWRQSRVVRTLDALAVARAADLVITAAGYNSFHEVIYNRLPAIFIPQMAEFMDDQDRRARAAAERGLAVTLEAKDLLLLEREIARLLDGGGCADLRKALTDTDLPQTGTGAAAAIIDAEAER